MDGHRDADPADMRPKDWRAAGRGYPVGTWMIAIAKDGTLSVYRPRNKPVDFKTAIAVDGNGLTIDTIPVCLTETGDYGWHASATQLTLTVAGDAKCAPRAALFGGTWTRQ
jgi:hypothetical protein